jgi:ISXO2 transposase-like protein/transposase-like zinc ribbon protein
MTMAECTFKQFQEMYPSDDVCLAKLMEVNYGGTEIVCPGCGVDSKFHPLSKRRAFVCQYCGHHIYPCADTIFHKSRTKLTEWFFVMYLMTSTRHGVAAKEVERQLGVTYKCAWRMCHELRKLMASADFGGPLGGGGKHVEIDETVMGGYQSNRNRRRKGSNKSLVFGIVERDGMLRAGPIPDLSQNTLESIVREHVIEGTKISADEWDSYNDLKYGFDLGRVNHSKKQWTWGEHHTNTIEGQWGHFKRAVLGTHVHISAKHMWKYVAEFTYRRNYRHSHMTMFDRLVAACGPPRLQDA